MLVSEAPGLDCELALGATRCTELVFLHLDMMRLVGSLTNRESGLASLRLLMNGFNVGWFKLMVVNEVYGSSMEFGEVEDSWE